MMMWELFDFLGRKKLEAYGAHSSHTISHRGKMYHRIGIKIYSHDIEKDRLLNWSLSLLLYIASSTLVFLLERAPNKH